MDQYAYLIVTGAPDNTEFGIDLLAINITDEFRGVKLIPPGAHFIYSSAKDSFGNTSTARNGFLHYFKTGEIVVKEWNAQLEELQDRSKGDLDLEKQRIKEHLKDLDRFLAMYEYENLNKWKQLTNMLSEEAIKRLSPESGMIRNSIEFKSCPDKDRPRGKPEAPIRNIKIRSNEDEAMYLPNLEIITETQPKYSKLPERFTKTTPPADVTFNNIDTVNLVEKLFNEITSKTQLLEELQHSFIVYFCGFSVDSLSHWRQIVSLLCNSERSVEKDKNFYKSFVNIIKHQIPEIPVEFIEQNSSNTIYQDVRNLLRNLVVNNCAELSDNLQMHLKNYIGWTFEDFLEDDPEDLPQIVEM
ncbi:CLUMA_CG008581, isoform A [Clunio marinus]|uniref:Protein AAR2 homolog n=1 Tax=Clunio marinus TaxID=568069 RepID=A0A1J1I436_9DIPT|nr:CLUMA_CG008581, isoform A [Clunio marinus]